MTTGPHLGICDRILLRIKTLLPALFVVAGLAAMLIPASLLQAAEKTAMRYVIIHADDAGMSHNVNLATIEAMEKGVVSSASIMVPCPWFSEFAAYARTHPQGDYGIHLTLNSEWKHFKWGPVAPASKVPSLVDKQGYLWDDVPEFAANAKAGEVEIELRAQIDRALKFGVPLSHLDSHMGALVSRPDLIEVYVNLGIEYNLPILFSRSTSKAVAKKYPALAGKLDSIAATLDAHGLPVLDTLTTGVNDGTYEQRKASYLKVLREQKPGTTSEIIIHCGIADSELKGITARWRQRDEDRRIFTDPDVIAEIKKMGIKPIGWRQLREMNDKKKSSG